MDSEATLTCTECGNTVATIKDFDVSREMCADCLEAELEKDYDPEFGLCGQPATGK